jgi:hypothetical protein
VNRRAQLVHTMVVNCCCSLKMLILLYMKIGKKAFALKNVTVGDGVADVCRNRD